MFYFVVILAENVLVFDVLFAVLAATKMTVLTELMEKSVTVNVVIAVAAF